MVLISAVVLMVLAGGLFFYSLPRGGKVARFVGTQWEPYVTILIICFFGLGALLAVAGVTDVLEVSYDG